MEKLELMWRSYSSQSDLNHTETAPNIGVTDLVNKINEIVEWINTQEAKSKAV